MSPTSPTPGLLPFSLVRGGPLDTLLHIGKLARDDVRDPYRKSAFFVTLTWMPLVVLGLVERLIEGRWDPLLRDYAVHGRMLVGIPLLFLSEGALHVLSGVCVERFLRGRFADETAVYGIVGDAERSRDARAPELFIAALALLTSQTMFWAAGSSQGLAYGAAPVGLAHSPAVVWYGVVALPIAQFLFVRWLWRWFIWARVLFRLSRLPLHLSALHPDRRGGVGFLAEPTLAFAPGVAVISVVQAGTWATRMTLDGSRLQTFATPFSVMVLAAMLFVLGPLLPWCVPMWRTRLHGQTELGDFAVQYVDDFEKKWLDTREAGTPLGSSDIQSLADLANSFGVARAMRLVPFDAISVATITLAMLAPAAPLILTEIPLGQILRGLLSGAIGVRIDP